MISISLRRLVTTSFIVAACGGTSAPPGSEASISEAECPEDAGQMPAEIPAPRLTPRWQDTGLTVTSDPASPNVIAVAGVATGHTISGAVSFLSVDIDGAAQNLYSEPRAGDTALEALSRLKAAIERYRSDDYLAAVSSIGGGTARLTVTRTPGSDGKNHSEIMPGITVKPAPDGHLIVEGETPSAKWNVTATSSVAADQVRIVIDASTETFVHHLLVVTPFRLDLMPLSEQCARLTGSVHVVVMNYRGRKLTEADVSL